MATDRWSRGENEYKTFVTSRRDGVFERRAEEGSARFSLKYDQASNLGMLAMVAGDGRSRDQELDQHAVGAEEEVVSQFYDIPLSLQLRWKSTMQVRGSTRPISAHHLHDQFEFTVKKVTPEQTPVAAAPVTRTVSSAEKPTWRLEAPILSRSEFLHTPKNDDQKAWVIEEHFISRRMGNSDAVFTEVQSSGSRTQAVLQPTYSKVYAKASNDTPADSMMDSRSSSFDSRSSSTFESTGHERETLGEEDQQTISDQESSTKQTSSGAANGHLNNTSCRRDDSVTQLKLESSCPEPLWLRIAVKLKGLFGGKKSPKSSGDERLNVVLEHPRPTQYSESRRTHAATTHPMSWSRASRHSCTQQQHETDPARRTSRHSYTATSTASSCKGTRAFASGRSSNPALIQSRINAKHSSTKESNRREHTTGYTVYSECLPPTFDNTNGRGTRDQANLSKMQEYWLQYMKILKPPYGATSPHGKPDQSQTATVARPSPKTKEKIPKYCPKYTPAASADDVEHVRMKSMPAIEKTQVRPLNYSSSGGAAQQVMSHISPRLVPDRSAVSCNSAPAGAKHSRLPSAVLDSTTSSPKLSNNKLSMRSLKVKNSPKLQVMQGSSPGRRTCNTNSSTMSELHSSVQGAIAHCKRSHSSHLSQASDIDQSSYSLGAPATQLV